MAGIPKLAVTTKMSVSEVSFSESSPAAEEDPVPKSGESSSLDAFTLFDFLQSGFACGH